MDVEQKYERENTTINFYSKKTNKLLCARNIPQDGIETYFVFNMPDDDERVQPKAIRQIKLETKEEVQAFFNALNKVLKENKND